MIGRRAALIIGLLLACSCSSAYATDERDFKTLLERVADGWNRGDAKQAVDCFTEDAVYVEPPDRQVYKGRAALFEFFGGNDPNPPRMSMTWHAIAFDASAQTGFGEYTFASSTGFQAHGIVRVQLRDGHIATWREYQTRNKQPFRDFAGDSLR